MKSLNKFFIVIGAICALLFVLILGFIGYMGGFREMVVKEQDFGPFYLFYHSHTGPYSEVSQLHKKVTKIIAKEKLKSEASFGIYYDDPSKVEKSKLRSEVGVILTKVTAEKYTSTLIKNGLRFKLLAKRPYIFTSFPFHNVLSIFFGLSKAYPALGKYSKEKQYPEYKYNNKPKGFALEIYNENEILYLMTAPPIAQ